MPSDRRNWQARLTPEASLALDRMLDRRRITYTAFAEALALHLRDAGDDWLPDAVIRRARQIDVERYSRRQRNDDA